MVETKLPDPDPERHIGRWAVSMSHELYRIEEVQPSSLGPVWIGKSLRGGCALRSAVPTLLTRKDGLVLDALLEARDA